MGEEFHSHLCRVSGYKEIDDYADANHFQPNKFAPSVAFVIRPEAPLAIERIKPYWDVEEAADIVAFHRSRGK